MANEKRVRADFVFGTTDTALDGTGSTKITHADDFNRADGAIGGSWSTLVGSFSISSNQAKAGSANSTVVIETNKSDVVIEVDFVTTTGGACVAFRYVSAGNGWIWLPSSGVLYRYDGGSLVNSGITTTTTIAAGERAQVTLSGTSATFKNLTTAATSTYDIGTTYSTATKHGLRGDDATAAFDNFSAVVESGTAATSTLSSPALSRLPVIDTTGHAAIALTDAATGNYEIVHAISHAAGAATATVQRAREGSTAREWPSGTTWQHGPTAKDISGSVNGWDLAVNLPLTSLTSWTAEGGTWTAETDRIRQSATAVATNRLRYEGLVLPGDLCAEIDVRIDAIGDVAWAGLTFGVPSAGGIGGVAAFIRSPATTTASSEGYFEIDGAHALGQVVLSANIAHGTWATLRYELSGDALRLSVNGNVVSSFRAHNYATSSAPVLRPHLGLISRSCDASYRNLKVWTRPVPF